MDADGVSILVVMERTHRHADSRPGPALDLSGFNPCCDGTDSSTGRAGGWLGNQIWVSILVVMERTHRLFLDSLHANTEFSFQSLL